MEGGSEGTATGKCGRRKSSDLVPEVLGLRQGSPKSCRRRAYGNGNQEYAGSEMEEMKEKATHDT